MGVVVGRATANKSAPRHTTGSRQYSSSRSSSRSGRYVRDDATIQAALNAFGHDAGKPDGVFGPKTQSAIRTYQTSIGDEPTGQLSAPQRAQLLADYAALVNRNNNNGSGSGSGTSDGNGNGSPTKTATTDDFLQRLRQQGGAKASEPAKTTDDTKSADAQDATTQVASASFDEICSRFEQTSTEARVIDVSMKTGPSRADALMLEQLCTARSYALQNLEADLAALGNLDIANASEECNAFTATQTEALAAIGSEEPDATVASFEQVFGEIGDQKDAVVRSTRVCLGLAYAFDSAEGAIVSATSLAALGEPGYGELVGEHLATGIGVDRNGPLAAEWMEWTASAIDDGAKPVVDVEGYDRAPLLRVLAEVATDTTANKVADASTTGKRGGLLLPGMQTGTREDDAVTFFASESVAMIKSLETMMLAIGLDRSMLQSTCAADRTVSEPLSVRVCRAFAYATRDFEGMQRYDQLLAEAGDKDAGMRVSLYESLGEQGIAKLVATNN
jgi:Putative peptidoglycan binding domain